jgi:hypothetical protein
MERGKFSQEKKMEKGITKVIFYVPMERSWVQYLSGLYSTNGAMISIFFLQKGLFQLLK